MRKLLRRHWPWFAAALALGLAGAVLIARAEIDRQREAFDTDARIAHRLLSQRVVQHDAILATLALLQPEADARAEQRLPALYPQILAVHRRDAGEAWKDPAWRTAEVLSRAQRRPALAGTDLPRGRYELVLAAEPASFALSMDLNAVVPWSEWPQPKEAPARLVLEHGGQAFVIQPGRASAGEGWRFDFRKHLAADSQPFDVVASRTVGWAELPWPWMAAWALLSAFLVGTAAAYRRQRVERERAEELLRLGQVGRLNALGELAAGMAHELNQPLTAVLANTQAASRLLDEEPPDIATARNAMQQAVQQGRRAADVVGRMRRAIERPDVGHAVQAVPLQEAVRNAFHLLEPEFARHAVTPKLLAPAPVAVQAEPVALEQIIHNLLVNALQALDHVPEAERALTVELGTSASYGVLLVRDSGPGLAPEVLPRVFEPFFSTRAQGLGLGLSLCESLASNMGGRLEAVQSVMRGAAFRLTLPLAAAA